MIGRMTDTLRHSCSHLVVRALLVLLMLAAPLALVGTAEAVDLDLCPDLTINASSTSPPTPAFLSPSGVDVDSSGNIYAGDPISDTVYRFDSSGTQTLAIDETSPTPDFFRPGAVAVDGSGN